MWKTLDGYTLTMPRSELEALAAEHPAAGCGCRACAVEAVTRELGELIGETRRTHHTRATSAHRGRKTRARGTAHTSHGTASRSATFSGGSGSQFRTRPLPGRRHVIYAYTPPPWAIMPPPPAAPDCSPDDPSCAQASDGDADSSADDSGELEGTVLAEILRGW